MERPAVGAGHRSPGRGPAPRGLVAQRPGRRLVDRPALPVHRSHPQRPVGPARGDPALRLCRLPALLHPAPPGRLGLLLLAGRRWQQPGRTPGRQGPGAGRQDRAGDTGHRPGAASLRLARPNPHPACWRAGASPPRQAGDPGHRCTQHPRHPGRQPRPGGRRLRPLLAAWHGHGCRARMVRPRAQAGFRSGHPERRVCTRQLFLAAPHPGSVHPLAPGHRRQRH